MKNAPAGLATLLATGQFNYCDLYHFTLWDNATHLRYTNLDVDVVVSANTVTCVSSTATAISGQSTSTAGSSPRTFVQRIEAAAYTTSVGTALGFGVQVTFAGGTTAANLRAAWVGNCPGGALNLNFPNGTPAQGNLPFSFDGFNQTQLTFGGASTGSIPVSGTLVSDVVPMNFDPSRALLVAFDLANANTFANVQFSTVASGNFTLYTSTKINNANVINKSGYTAVPNNILGVQSVVIDQNPTGRYSSKSGAYFDTLRNKATGHWKTGLDLDSWTIQVLPTPIDPATGNAFPAKIYGQPWLAAVRAGALRGATVEIHRFYTAAWPSPWASPLPANVTTTFDPKFLYPFCTLSDSNLTITSSGVAGFNTSSRSLVSYSSGKYYAEWTIRSLITTQGIGICNATEATIDNLGGTINGISALNDGNIYFDFVLFLAAVGSFSSTPLGNGDVIRMALDLDNLAIYFCRNNGNWNNSATADPATNTGGLSLQALGSPATALPGPPYFAAAQCRASDVGTVNFGATKYAFQIPAGYQNWGTTGYILPNLFTGRVADIQITREEATLTVNSWVEILQRVVPRNVYQAPCRWTLFDSGCQVDKNAFAFNGTVKTVISQGQFTSTMATNQADGYFALGSMIWTSGNNVGFPVAVRAFQSASQTYQLIRPAPFSISAGDTFTAYAGCDKKVTTCTNKFNAFPQFGGFPFIPAAETAV